MQIDTRAGIQTSKKISTMDYYRHQLMIRTFDDNFVLRCAGLLNQFVVDMWAKIESERLLFLRLNQSNSSVDSYIHLGDAIVNDLVFTRICRLAAPSWTGISAGCQLSNLATLALFSGEKSPLNSVGMPYGTLASLS